MNPFESQSPVTPAPDSAPLNQTIRRRLGRVGWGVLLYLLAAQTLGAILVMIPQIGNNIYLTMAVNEVVNYGVGHRRDRWH